MKVTTDIDIDVADRRMALKTIPHIPAMIAGKEKPELHNTGIYIQNIPTTRNGLAAIEYKTAEDLGYFKIDILNNSIYNKVRDNHHLVSLTREPMWELLEFKEIVDQLAHIRDHYDLVDLIKPKSIEELSIVLALIRPSKRHLANKHIDEIRAEIWEKPTDGSYYFKKSHSVAYALSIVVQLNLLTEELAND